MNQHGLVIFTLYRDSYSADGIFGLLLDENDVAVATTLEHAYPAKAEDVDTFEPKLAPGVYTCLRGKHQLYGMDAPFDAFEIMDVPSFQGVPVTGILFHVGNYNRDSEGCILLGQTIDVGQKMVVRSREAFAAFMGGLVGVDSFQLTVVA